MTLALGTAGIVMLALVWELARPRLRGLGPTLTALRGRAHMTPVVLSYDPGREIRAEQRAGELLRSCVNEEEWAMYRDLGFVRIWGAGGSTARSRQLAPEQGAGAGRAGGAGAAYAYLLYPHKPLLAYVPQTGLLLNEYCVTFSDEERPYGSARLPDADDVLAKWMALKADERGLIEQANMHLPGRQIDPARASRDLERLASWERERSARGQLRAHERPAA